MKIKLYFRVKAIIEHKKTNAATIVGQKYLINYNPEEYLEVYVDAEKCQMNATGAILVPLDLFCLTPEAEEYIKGV